MVMTAGNRVLVLGEAKKGTSDAFISLASEKSLLSMTAVVFVPLMVG